MKRIAVFPGSFDPITIGHLDIVKRSLPLFDEIVVAIGNNSAKKYFFPLAKRLELLKNIFKEEEQVSINAYEGLTVDFCKSENAQFIIRGLRSSTDFEYEKTIALFNKELKGGVETIFMASSPQYSHISSTVVREILKYGGDVSSFVPKEIATIVV